MLKLTKFLGFHNEFFGQEIPIRNNSLARIHTTFHGNVLSIPEVTSFVINKVHSLNYILFENIFRILVIASIASSMS
jgi:hypothetical protein